MATSPTHWMDDDSGIPTPDGRSFLLDTNVLLHDPQALYRFVDNNLVIPMTVVEEIDRFRLRDISLIEVLRQPRYGQQHSEDQKRGLAPADMATNAQFDVPRRLSSRTPPILNK